MLNILYASYCTRTGLTNLQRISLGLLLSVIGMAAATMSELKRQSVARANPGTSVLPVSVFFLIPQFLLIGAGEAFTYTGQLDFFITESPKGMKGLSTGLFLVTISLGFFVSSFLVFIIQKITTSFGSGQGWIGDNINKGRLDCFYGLLCMLSFINFGLFIVAANWYTAQKSEPILQKISPAEEC